MAKIGDYSQNLSHANSNKGSPDSPIFSASVHIWRTNFWQPAAKGYHLTIQRVQLQFVDKGDTMGDTIEGVAMNMLAMPMRAL
jgi:hypothetical protein